MYTTIEPQLIKNIKISITDVADVFCISDQIKIFLVIQIVIFLFYFKLLKINFKKYTIILITLF